MDEDLKTKQKAKEMCDMAEESIVIIQKDPSLITIYCELGKMWILGFFCAREKYDKDYQNPDKGE